MKRILVTGASGFVGSRVVKAGWRDCELLTPSHGQMDITSPGSIREFMEAERPDSILHLAAISNTGYCEEHPEESYLVNVQGVVNLAEAATHYNAKFVFFSSDQIYNGNPEKGLLSEDIPTNPVNHYGCHKKMAEEESLRLCPDSVALRASWMYDSCRRGMPTHGNFVLNIMKAIESGDSLSFGTLEYRGITWVEEVVQNLPHCFCLPGGVYNFGAENTLNTYETALAYCDILKCPDGDRLILPDHRRFAPTGRNISISMRKAAEASDGRIKFRDTVEGLIRFNNEGM